MIKLTLKIYIATFLLFSGICSTAQVDPRRGDDLYKIGNFLEATKEFTKQYKVDPHNAKVLFKLAKCYLNTNENKAAAIQFLEKALAQEKHNKETQYYLAIAYTHGNQYQKAIESLKEYQKVPGKFIDEVPKMIESYKLSIELMQKPINVTFENMGQFINSQYPDYFPFVTQDEKTMVFTSRRKEGKGSLEFDGFYSSDIYVSSFDGVHFSGAKNSGSLNSIADEQCVGIYDDGSKIFVYIDNFVTKERGNIYEAVRKGPIYGKKKKIKEGVNTESIETSTSVSSDGNSLIYASNRPGGAGGTDIYITRKLPSGTWGMPQNIYSLNTPNNEDFPTLSPDGKTLYFSSDGFPGMGGYDLYKSKWDEENMEWAYPENLGYPLNTSYDEKVISFADDEKHAYVTAVREEGFGNLDIYRITFEEVEVRPALFIISLHDVISNEKLKGGVITIFMDDEDEPRSYIANKNTQEFSLILPPGKYELEIEANGYDLSIHDFVVSEFDADKVGIKKEIKLTK